MLDKHTQRKLDDLKLALANLGSVAVAFSGGVDSALLAKVSHDVLGERAVAYTVRIAAVPTAELNDAVTWCAHEGIEHHVLDVDVLSLPGFRDNPPDRCYHCKRHIFFALQNAARERGLQHVAEGSNMDDLGDYRPGLRALSELGIRSPLQEAGLAKRDIRAMARELGLPQWSKPSAACLASRIPYGSAINAQKLSRIEAAEKFLHDQGFSALRVRAHGDRGELARIELEPSQIARLLEDSPGGDGSPLRSEVNSRLKEIGFTYVCVDLKGFRSGSMNEVL